MAHPDVDVAVVGDGIAGLVARRNLVRCGHEVAVLETRNRVEGRVRHDPARRREARGHVVRGQR